MNSYQKIIQNLHRCLVQLIYMTQSTQEKKTKIKTVFQKLMSTS